MGRGGGETKDEEVGEVHGIFHDDLQVVLLRVEPRGVVVFVCLAHGCLDGASSLQVVDNDRIISRCGERFLTMVAQC